MTISYVGGIDANNATIGGAVVIPVDVIAGDRLIVFLESNSVSGYSHLTPDGWSLLDTFTGASGQPGGSTINSAFTRVAGAGDAGTTATFEITPTGSSNTACLVVYRGTTTTPQVLGHDLLPFTGSASTSVAVPVLSVASLPTTLVTAASVKSGSGTITFTQPSGFTSRVTDTIAGNTLSTADAAAGSTGDTAVAAWTKSLSSAAGAGFLIVLTEGDPPVQTQPIFRRLTIDGWYPTP